MNINQLIELWVINTPYPHVDDENIIKNVPNGNQLLCELKKILYQVFEFENIVRGEYLSLITPGNTNEEIKAIFEKIRQTLLPKLITRDRDISNESYIKLIDILIYNCFMH
ncbi:MAG: hypothetical protein E7060_03440 [Treponema bryantii]|nr:hypothetical protein [Treponema bryantii]